MTELEKIRKKVLKKAPTAKLLVDSEKNFYIDVDGVNLSEEHLLPPTNDPQRAWEFADISLRVTQNLNRTHPLRTGFYPSTDKKERINRRRKTKDGYSGY